MNYYEPTITVQDNTIEVVAPYNLQFREGALALAGLFKRGTWTFSLRDEVKVRKLCDHIYGYDGITTTPKIDVSVEVHREMLSGPNKSIDIMRRPVARATDKPGVLIGHGIIIEQGAIVKKGHRALIEAGTRLTFREVPYALYESESKQILYQQQSKIDVSHYSIAQITPARMELEMMFFEHDQLVKRYKALHSIFTDCGVSQEHIDTYIALHARPS